MLRSLDQPMIEKNAVFVTSVAPSVPYIFAWYRPDSHTPQNKQMRFETVKSDLTCMNLHSLDTSILLFCLPLLPQEKISRSSNDVEQKNTIAKITHTQTHRDISVQCVACIFQHLNSASWERIFITHIG